jgi:hypothetical protein
MKGPNFAHERSKKMVNIEGLLQRTKRETSTVIFFRKGKEKEVSLRVSNKFNRGDELISTLDYVDISLRERGIPLSSREVYFALLGADEPGEEAKALNLSNHTPHEACQCFRLGVEEMDRGSTYRIVVEGGQIASPSIEIIERAMRWLNE